MPEFGMTDGEDADTRPDERPGARQGAEQRARILIVDDMRENIQLLAAALQGSYEVFFAQSGEEALRVAVTQRVELILLDIMMPEVDGYEVCRLLKLDPALAEIPVIFVTAKTAVEDEAKGFEVGGVDYITKPITPLLIQARVRTHLELHAARERLKRLAAQDHLTGIPNRPAFDEVLARELRRAHLEAEPLSVLLVGLDGLGNFNDRLGYRAGDQRLKQMAELLAHRPERPMDFTARYRAAVFGLICPDTDQAGAEDVARHLLGLLSASVGSGGDDPAVPALRASISGVTVPAPSSDLQERGAERLAEDAERLLLQAQRAGQNQLWISTWDDLSA
jgi:diguanylate cyclase (GGDEF)-like protein